MGVFPPPIPNTFVALINMFSSIGTHMGDPWVLPNLAEIETFGDTMPLSPTELYYSAIQSEFESTVCFSQENELDQYSLPDWVDNPSSPSHEFLSKPFLSDKEILEAMMVSERHWECSQQSLGLSNPRVVPSPIASSLLVCPNLIPLLSSSLGEHLLISNHTFWRPREKGGRHR